MKTFNAWLTDYLSKFILVFTFCLITGAHAYSMPERVVTLAPNLAEWVAEMMGPEETKQHLVGVSEYSDYPSYVSSTTSIGPYPRVNIEKILKLNPTLVIALSESNDEEQLKQLERLKIKVVRMPQEKFFGMNQWILNLGSALGEPKRATIVANRWKSQIQKINLHLSKTKVGERKTFIEVQDEPIVTVGGRSFLSDAFKMIGYKNVFMNLTQAYPKVSRESVVASNPHYIFILDLRGNDSDFEQARDRWRKFKEMKAVAQDQIKFLKGDDYGRCSFRLLYAMDKLI